MNQPLYMAARCVREVRTTKANLWIGCEIESVEAENY